MTQATIAIVNQGDRIPFDGKILEGLAFVDESAQTGVSTPALLEAAAGRDDVIKDTLVVEGWLKIESQPRIPIQVQPRTTDLEETATSGRETQSSPVVEPKTNPLIKVGVALLLAVALAMVFALIAYAASHSTHTAGATGVAGFLLGGVHSLQNTPPR